MAEPIHRRQFLGAAAAGTALGLAGATAGQEQPRPAQNQQSASNKLVVGVMGTGGRGTELAQAYQRQTNVEVAYVCDVDRGRAERAAGLVQRAVEGARAPRA